MSDEVGDGVDFMVRLPFPCPPTSENSPAFIHRTSWKVNSRNFACVMAFSEVRDPAYLHENSPFGRRWASEGGIMSVG
jgi:hypothetical protein